MSISPGQTPTSLTIDTVETAGIDGRDWDQSFPGAVTVDAVHRSVLVRFPGAAARIAERLAAGGQIARAELVLTYEAHELDAPGYTSRVGMMLPQLKANPPRWHITAAALDKAWRSPTFNAYLNDAGYWAKYGAQADRFDVAFAPAEVSVTNTEGRIDVTAAVINPVFGADLGTRLRGLDERGFLLKKLEIYDFRYKGPDWGNSYEWAVPTGGHGLRFKPPQLVVTFQTGAPLRLELPAATDLDGLAARLKADGTGGQPTAVLPSPVVLQELTRKAVRTRPGWMADWQWTRTQELRAIGGGVEWAAALESGDARQYGKVVHEILATLPRYWKGWGIQDDLLLWYRYHEILPAPVQDHLRLYWDSWLMPDRPTRSLVHPMTDEQRVYWEKTQDWRGNASFFRSGFCEVVSTMNFNHTAAMGALLGGNVIGSEAAMGDGRHGLEKMLLRFWNFQDGTSQETLDHYYLGITLSAQKMFADFGPTGLDRLMGRMILDRQMELLMSAYHPNLRRIIGSSGRTNFGFLFGKQDGIYHALHTLSPSGALIYPHATDQAQRHGVPMFGHDFPAGRAALQTLAGPWAEAWAANIVDSKPLPYEVTATETTRGNYHPPLWQRVYLGHHYGMASQDIKGGTVDFMAQWNSAEAQVSDMEQLSTLTARYTINNPDLSTTHGGTMPYQGAMVTFQHRNKAIICAKPRTEKSEILQKAGGTNGVQTLATSIALWNFRDPPGWQVFVDGQPVTELPVKLHERQIITIKDGPSFVGIIPLPATDLGRTDAVVIGPGPESAVENGGKVKPALLIQSFNLQRTVPLDLEKADWDTITTAACGGFIVEVSDQSEYRDFAAFQKHLVEARLDTRWEPAAKTLHIDYHSGADRLEMGFCTAYAQGSNTAHFVVQPGQQTVAIPYRRVNGAWPYLPAGIDRDTTLSQQGTTGRLEKNGAVLVTEPGHPAYLITEPVSGSFVGYNPFPDPVAWSFSVPGGLTVKADGPLGLARVTVQPKANQIRIEHQTKSGQSDAAALLVSGAKSAPAVVLNGEPLANLSTRVVDGQTMYVVPLR